MIRFRPPQFSHSVTWTGLPRAKFTSQTSYTDLRLEEADLSKTSTDGVHVNCGLFKKINLSNSQFDKLKLLDVKILDSNLSNFKSQGSNLIRVEIRNCKITGQQFINSSMESVLFENCYGQYFQLRFARCRHVIFKSCNLKGGDFTDSDLSDCQFINCDLSDCEFSGVKLVRTDLRGSNLEKITVGVREIRGAIINTTQALYLTGLLGVNIKD